MQTFTSDLDLDLDLVLGLALKMPMSALDLHIDPNINETIAFYLTGVGAAGGCRLGVCSRLIWE